MKIDFFYKMESLIYNYISPNIWGFILNFYISFSDLKNMRLITKRDKIFVDKVFYEKAVFFCYKTLEPFIKHFCVDVEKLNKLKKLGFVDYDWMYHHLEQNIKLKSLEIVNFTKKNFNKFYICLISNFIEKLLITCEDKELKKLIDKKFFVAQFTSVKSIDIKMISGPSYLQLDFLNIFSLKCEFLKNFKFKRVLDNGRKFSSDYLLYRYNFDENFIFFKSFFRNLEKLYLQVYCSDLNNKTLAQILEFNKNTLKKLTVKIIDSIDFDEKKFEKIDLDVFKTSLPKLEYLCVDSKFFDLQKKNLSELEFFCKKLRRVKIIGDEFNNEALHSNIKYLELDDIELLLEKNKMIRNVNSVIVKEPEFEKYDVFAPLIKIFVKSLYFKKNKKLKNPVFCFQKIKKIW